MHMTDGEPSPNTHQQMSGLSVSRHLELGGSTVRADMITKLIRKQLM